MVREVGRHNLRFMFPNRLKRWFVWRGSLLSMWTYDHFPTVEKMVIGRFFHGRSKTERLRDKRRGIAKSYTNPN